MLNKTNPAKAVVCFLLCLFLSGGLFAQKKITGKIIGSNIQPVAGASVQVQGTTLGTVTTTEGSFAITVPAGKNVLMISAVGYKSKEITIGSETDIPVTLEEDVSGLTEVIVTGYSGQQRKAIVGAVTTVKGEQLATVQTGNVEQQFQGRVPGLTVITSGQPGTTSQVRIRGFGSFSGNDPLYVVDGIPTTNIDFLNGNDIESTTVLKDASSASIYGARASAGVILVTTKKGKASNGLKVTYDLSYGLTIPGNGIDLLTPRQQADLTWEALKAAGQTLTHPQYGTGASPVLPDYLKVGSENGLSGLSPTDPRLDPAKFNVNFDKGPIYQVIKANKAGTDWYDALTETNPIQNHTLGFRGGNENAKYYAGLSYYDEQGTVINTNVKRYSLRLNSEFKVKNKIRFGQNFQFTFRENPNIGFGPASENSILFALTINPLIPVYDEGGGFAGTTALGFNNSTNPVAARIRSKGNRGFSSGIFGNLYAEVDFLEHFTFRSSFGGNFGFFQSRFLNYRTYENSENVGSYTFGEAAGNAGGWTWTNTVKYSQVFGKHNVNFIGGIESIADGYFRFVSGQGLNPFTINPSYLTITNTDASGRAVNSGGNPLVKLFSQFGKVDYTYDDKYLFSGTLRRDGASVFGENDQYGVFPAISAGWRITEESFMKDISWLNELKIRGGWGKMGNSRISPNNQSNTGSASVFGYDITGANTSTSSGLALTGLGNPNAKWEENTTINIGFDGTLLKNKLDIIFDWYTRKTKDLLFRDNLPATVGSATRPFVNIGSMKNSGVDLMLTYKGRASKLRYEADFIITKYKNEITKVSDGTDFFNVNFTNRIGGGDIRNAKGHPVSAFYGYQVIGLFQDATDVSKSPTQNGAAPGRFKYADIAGNADGSPDGKIDDKDRTYIGNPNPDFTYGFNARLVYGNFDLEALFYGVAGGKVLNFTRWFTDFYPSFAGIGKSTRALNAWTPTNTNTDIPRFENVSNFSTNGVLNSYYVEKGSYFRMRSLKIGYTLPTATLRRVGIDKLRLFLQGTNLFTITKYTGTDPAVSGVDTNFGVDVGNYPVNRQILFGLSVGL